jgi:hypothetical protein
MSSVPTSFPRSSIGRTGRAVRVLDLAVVVWVAAWITIGILIGVQVRNLRQLSDTVVTAGTAIERTGQALAPLERLPFGLGSNVGRVRTQIEGAGRSAVASGVGSRASIDRLSLLLMLSILLIPTVPLAAVYVPLRLSWSRDVRAVRRALARSGHDPLFLEFLARRALLHLPYHRLREVSADPWRDLEAGRHVGLAKAELDRLGLDPSLLESDARTAA